MKKALKNLYKSYFSLSQGERTGFIVLLSLILLITVIPFFESKTNKEITNFDSFDSLVIKSDSLPNDRRDRLLLDSASSKEARDVSSFGTQPDNVTSFPKRDWTITSWV